MAAFRALCNLGKNKKTLVVIAEFRRFHSWRCSLWQASKCSMWAKSQSGISFSCNNRTHGASFSTALQTNTGTTNTYSESTSLNKKNEPLSFSKSPAQNHKVEDTLRYDPRKLNSMRTFLLCFGLFSSIVYFGFLRRETDAEKKIFELKETD